MRSPVLDLGGRIAERQVKGREAVGFRGEGEFHFKWARDVKRIARVEMKVGIQSTVVEG